MTINGVDFVMAPAPAPDVAVTTIVAVRGFLRIELGFELELRLELEPHPTPQSAALSRQKMANVVFHWRRMPNGKSKPAKAMLANAPPQWLIPMLPACFALLAIVKLTTDGFTPLSATLLSLKVQVRFIGGDPQES